MTKTPRRPRGNIFSASLVVSAFLSNAIFAVEQQEPTAPQSLPDSVSTAAPQPATALTPNLERGRQLYETCAICHTPMGWGTPDGRYPQIAGQHSKVIIKQLEDIRQGNRDNPTMYPFTQTSILPDEQAIADIAGYISRLPMNPHNQVGPGNDLEHGKTLYEEHCVKCHGDQGQGDNAEHYPRIQGQTYAYLLRQMFWIKNAKRRNADETMIRQIENFSVRDLYAVIDYASRLHPNAELLASEPEWYNPDFPQDFRSVPMMPPPFPPDAPY